jgi:hypothetical protein
MKDEIKEMQLKQNAKKINKAIGEAFRKRIEDIRIKEETRQEK